MTITQTPTKTKSKSPAPDERVAKRNPFQKLLGRPEVGALVGAVVLFVFFAFVSTTFTQPNAFATILYGSSTIGIMAVGVSLLMIGGEFDLSTGVAVISSALTASLFSWNFSMNAWVGVLLALMVSLGIGFINGWILVKTKLPSFIVTLATFLMLTGLNLALTRLIGGSVSSPSISKLDGFESARAVFASSVNIAGVEVKITVFFWIVLVAVALGAVAHEGGELDLRGRRRRQCRPCRGCSGDQDQDRPVHGRGFLRLGPGHAQPVRLRLGAVR